MRLLLDTHIAIWMVTGDERLPKSAAALIADPGNGKYVSVVSLWEIATKFALNRGLPDEMPMSATDALSDFEAAEFRMLPVSPAHAAAVDGLPLLHGDPFDRLLYAQAMTEPLRLLTADRRLGDYGPLVLLA